MSDARAATDDLAESLMLLKREFRGRDYATCQAMLHVDREVGRMAARIRELEARQVPDGWQVVPKEPTRAMHDASDEILSGPSWTGVVPPDCRFDDYVRKLEWAAMLAAAPRP